MEPYIGQIGVFGFNFAPQGWAQCTGQLLPISQNTALFSLLGTIYGGDGRSTLALPDLRSRTPIGFDGTHAPGQMGGAEQITLTANQMPQHTHNVGAVSENAGALTLEGHFFAQGTKRSDKSAAFAYGAVANTVTLNTASVSMVGGSGPHNNIQPYQAVNFCIATAGLYPPRS